MVGVDIEIFQEIQDRWGIGLYAAIRFAGLEYANSESNGMVLNFYGGMAEKKRLDKLLHNGTHDPAEVARMGDWGLRVGL